MGERLAQGNVAIALLANAISTGSALVVLILTFGPISGAHFNPAVTLAETAHSRMGRSTVAAYLASQILGAFIGVFAAHLMFAEPIFQISTHDRSGGAQLVSEFIASFGLLCVIVGCSRRRPESVPMAVGLYITSAYWFTASTSFANPAVTLARSFTDTFAGIRPSDAPGFVVAQIAGAFVAVIVFQWLERDTPDAPGANQENAA